MSMSDAEHAHYTAAARQMAKDAGEDWSMLQSRPDTESMTDLEAAEMRVRQEERAYPADRSAWSIPLVDCAVRVFDAKDRVIAALKRELENCAYFPLEASNAMRKYDPVHVENIVIRAELQG